MTDTQFHTPFGIFQLNRLPERPRELLRAWDAADEYVLNTLAADSIEIERPLICNDNFGALSVALHSFNPVNWSDSLTAHKAMQKNLKLNGLAESDVSILDSLQLPAKPVRLVLIKVPKTLALFEYQLIRLKPLLSDKSQVIVAGMAKSMPAAVWKILERIIGPTKTSRAVKKAKVIQVTVNAKLALPEKTYPVEWKLEGSDYSLSNHANVFSREKLDIGTRFLLENLPSTEGPGDIIDLGCGNGVLGLMIASQNKQASLHFVDESYMAVESARVNFKQLSAESSEPTFHVSDDLSDFANQSTDLILCNPPFHQLQAVGDSVALSMFRESARVLRPDGELWVIGNRHLNYHKKLQHNFAQVELVASNKKFVILKASIPRI
ncbi:MAG: methyltransferase [Gammaproteobacteria bacterium]|nr:methyltransferase [Gammaproteobacteria bacterium]